MNTTLASWALALMTTLAAPERAPWGDTYAETARGIVAGAEAEPVFDGAAGVARTVALDVAVAMFESTFEPGALGDCYKLKASRLDPDPPRKARTVEGCRSHGLFQTDVRLPASAEEQTRYANRMIRASFRVCRDLPLEERLAWYAAGGEDGCRSEAGRRASRNRLRLAERLFRLYGGGAP